MDDDELEKTLDLLKDVGKVPEAYRVETFKGFRDNKEGGWTEVTIELWDAGTHRRDSRWRVRVTDENGREASGNPDDRLDVAFTNVHWDALDYPLHAPQRGDRRPR